MAVIGIVLSKIDEELCAIERQFFFFENVSSQN